MALHLRRKPKSAAGPAKNLTSKQGDLTSKQKLFVEAYLTNGGNGTQAALSAGYRARSAAQQASENLRKPEIQAAIQAAMAPRVAKFGLTLDRLEEELACITFLDPRRAYDKEGHLLPVDKMPEDVARALAGFQVEAEYGLVEDPLQRGKTKALSRIGTTTKVRWHNKTQAIELGMRRRGGLIDRHELEVGGAVSVFITINGIKRNEAA
jgi:phage terminase small subunit